MSKKKHWKKELDERQQKKGKKLVMSTESIKYLSSTCQWKASLYVNLMWIELGKFKTKELAQGAIKRTRMEWRMRYNEKT